MNAPGKLFLKGLGFIPAPHPGHPWRLAHGPSSSGGMLLASSRKVVRAWRSSAVAMTMLTAC
jgi:hypothetical protein